MERHVTNLDVFFQTAERTKKEEKAAKAKSKAADIAFLKKREAELKAALLNRANRKAETQRLEQANGKEREKSEIISLFCCRLFASSFYYVISIYILLVIVIIAITRII